MRRGLTPLVRIWLFTSLIVTGAMLLIYQDLTQVPQLAGRTDPTAIYEHPTLLFEDPGLIGSAIEVQVTEAVSACMESEGMVYRGPAVAASLEGLLGLGDGYGIATGPAPPGVVIGDGGPQLSSRGAYEQALYGSDLGGPSTGGGCAAVGLAQLDTSLANLASLPYSIEQLEANVLTHPAYVDALRRWSGCMAIKGYEVESPFDLIIAQADRLSSVRGEQARHLADEERIIAADDRDCRGPTIDAVRAEVAVDLAPLFVDSNRTALQALIPAPVVNVSPEGLGTGDVQVTLRWASSVDLDLEVVDPAGSGINYSTRTSPSGGELDRDANYPCGNIAGSPVENVFWPQGSAPQGSYQVEVFYRLSCGDLGVQPFELIVRVGGRVVLQETAQVEPGTGQSFEFGFPR